MCLYTQQIQYLEQICLAIDLQEMYWIKMKRLKTADITMNAQIVLVPDVNDKEELDKTINDLASLYPQLNSVAIVPIGITKYRENLCKIEIFDKESANEVINQIEKIQNELLDKLGTRFAFLSDEFYVMANRNLPTKEAYEGYVQLEKWSWAYIEIRT
jgi:Fe-S oxidoreductase, related to NifB/MoaA family